MIPSARLPDEVRDEKEVEFGGFRIELVRGMQRNASLWLRLRLGHPRWSLQRARVTAKSGLKAAESRATAAPTKPTRDEPESLIVDGGFRELKWRPVAVVPEERLRESAPCALRDRRR